MNAENGRLTLPRQIKREEFDYIKLRREAKDVKEEMGDGSKEPPLVGISISGGGVRSATFALGILQTLARKKILPVADYLATVSGGGYIGSCLTSLMTTPPPPLEAQRDAAAEPTQSAGAEAAPTEQAPPHPAEGYNMADDMPLLKREHVHHLRKHGDYLLLSRGVFRRDLMRGVGTLVFGVGCALLMFLLFQVAVCSAYIGTETVFVGSNFWTDMRSADKPDSAEMQGELKLTIPESKTRRVTIQATLQSNVAENTWPGIGNIWARLWTPTAWWYQPLTLAIFACLLSFLMALELGRFPVPPRLQARATTGMLADDRREINKLWLYSGVHIICGICLPYVLARGWPPSDDLMPEGSSLAGLLFHPAYFFGALVGTALGYAVFQAFGNGALWKMKHRSLVGALHGVSVYGLTFCLSVIGLTLLAWWAISGALWTWFAGGGIVSMISSRLLTGMRIRRGEPSSLMTFIGAVALHIGLILSVFVFLACTFVLCIYTLVISGVIDFRSGMICAGIAAGLFLLMGFLIDFNRVSLHYFYRDRLSETYLQTEDNGISGLEIIRDNTDLKLTDLLHRNEGSNPCPYQLIMCALNLAGSRDLARRDRLSDHFLFSRKFCGSTTTGYVRTGLYRGGNTKLSKAMTISGAAFSSGMGFYTSIAQSFAMTLFNLRLGYWVRNPRSYDDPANWFDSAEGKCPEHNGPPSQEREPADTSGRQHESNPKTPAYYYSIGNPSIRDNNTIRTWYRAAGPSTRWARRFAVWKCTGDRIVFWPYFLFLEMAALTHSDCTLVNLSDGGHTGDNIGLYPLFQRRCRLIIACDGEADPKYSFGSLANVIRQILVDENVKVDIDLDQLRPQEKEDLPQRHYLIGKIQYPRCDCPADDEPNDALRADRQPEDGWLLYLKSSLAPGVLPAAVRSYAATHPHFPHDTTIDQIFKDDQFEAYRILGAHVAGTALDAFAAENPSRATGKQSTAQQLMDWCEFRYTKDKAEAETGTSSAVSDES